VAIEAHFKHFIKAKSQVDSKLFSSLNAPPTTRCYFAFGEENATPICNCDESACVKSTCYGLFFQHQPTINIFVQNLPRKALNALERGIKGNGDVAFRNLTSICGTMIDVAFQNSTQRTPKNPTSHNPSSKLSMDLAFHNLSNMGKGCINNVVRGHCDHTCNKRKT
jgi:hypothetical protein